MCVRAEGQNEEDTECAASRWEGQSANVKHTLEECMNDRITTLDSVRDLSSFVHDAVQGLGSKVSDGDYAGLVDIMGHLMAIRDRQISTEQHFKPLMSTAELLKTYGQQLPESVYAQLEELPEKWKSLKKIAFTVKHEVAPLQSNEVAVIRRKCARFEVSPSACLSVCRHVLWLRSDSEVKQHEFREVYRTEVIFKVSVSEPYKMIDKTNRSVAALEAEMQKLQDTADLFEVSFPDYKQLRQCRSDLILVKAVWDMVIFVKTSIEEWTKTPWKEINVEQMDMELRRFAKEMKTLDKEVRVWNVYAGLEATVKNMLTSLRAVNELQNSAVRERHWQQLMNTTGVRFVMNESTTLGDLLELQLHRVEDEVKNIVDKAVKEMGIEKVLAEITQTWSVMALSYETHANTGTPLLKADENLIETLEDNQVQLQNILMSKYVEYFQAEVSVWQRRLMVADLVISSWLSVQRTWAHLNSIFTNSHDIRCQLAHDAERFQGIHSDFQGLMTEVVQSSNVVQVTNRPGYQEQLEALQQRLSVCEKALAEYLETKRLTFPRFYFVSATDLLEIVSKGTQPKQVTKHLLKLFDNIADLRFKDSERGGGGSDGEAVAMGMYSREGEYVAFSEPCVCEGQAECWLSALESTMCSTVRKEIQEAVAAYEDKPRDQWLFDYPAQVGLTGSQVWWATDVGIAFERVEEGFETALKDYNKKQITQLNSLIHMLLGELTPGDRQKIMTICTIDVHARDVVAKLIAQKVTTGQAFAWLSQLRHRWDEDSRQCYVNICDAQFQFSYEYLGNTNRLVITPLTDRCYITLTQSLHLTMSGAPSGPAGTGKTETTKDLGRSLGIMVYVFNCSEQMDYKSIGNIYKGLAQTGVWGCFDEFNRISVEVLSVVAVQVKTIQDAVRNKKQRFHFLGEEIELRPTVGIFITLNPGYAGRAELPENLKALFRPCAMVIPDFELICEIMLVAEGFIDARLLARKFISLYTLCKELLSKQDHYDWGLRAIKSVLVVAGSLKREERSRPEEQVLMRALRDFNLPKIVTSDVPIFLGLISDLFPQLDVPRKRDPELENAVRQSVSELRLQPEENFILKVTQLEELLAVRHSVFVVGGPGTGKSQILKTLHRTYANMKMKPVWSDINPKAVTTDELFGYLHPATREWKDGLFSSTMREMTSVGHDSPKWIVLDGDIDPMWIESLNTVMDDNKVLTLASNERISLSPSMRLLFEISHLRAATPATVSRAGILYVNPQDLGWSSYVTSWIDTRSAQSERANLTILFDKYVPCCLEQVRCNLKTITPIPENSMVQTLCSLLDCLLTEDNTPADSPRELYEIYFVFACVWAFGGALFQDQLVDHRAEFSRWWSKEMRAVKFPSQGTVFDYFIDSETKKFTPWSERMLPFELEPEAPLQTVLVHTAETICLTFFIDLLLQRGKPIMLVGNAGVGKSILVWDKVSRLREAYVVTKVPFNYYTTSAVLQRVLEKPLEKKAGRNYAPPAAKRLIYFIDDLNMPEVDVYGTCQPHTLIRQHLDYHHWYDRQRLVLKEIHSCQYITCMNPTAGSFSVNPRLQRHFSVFAVHFPSAEALATIFSSILSAHFLQGGFSYGVSRSVGTLIQAAICLHQKVSQNFLPTAIRFHYIFNLRDLSNIFQGILFAQPDCIRYPIELVHLWLHESSRVYSDKLMEEKDEELFNKILIDTGKRYFEGIDESIFIHQPLVYCHFSLGVGEPRYHQASDWEKLQKTLYDALEHYNELHAVMNLVLFEEAIQHVCRISRILEAPHGNALLVGVGGSGKQSLCRLAAFLSLLEVSQVTLRKGYGINDLRSDIAALYIKVGVKNIGTVFLHTDAQIPDERFLVLINDMLASGDIPDLFSDEDVDMIVTSIRMELRGLGLLDTRDNCWGFFIERIRRQLKVVLCFSPVGFTLRTRARKFPALVNCTAIDWFHSWPQLALQSVSSSFIEKIPALEPDVRASISEFISFAHTSVDEVSVKYQQNEKHFNYTTPKSFLEFIKLYSHVLGTKRTELTQKMERLENGLLKLQTTAAQVEDLKAKLAIQEVELWHRNTDTEALISEIGQQTDKLNLERAVADEEEQRVAAIQAEVTKQQRETEEDLAKAEPALQAANAALNTLNRLNLTELRTFPNPPVIVTNVSAAVVVLMAPPGRIPKDRSWKASKVVMSKVDDFLQALVNFDKEHIPEATVRCVRDEYLTDPEFNPDFVRLKSSAAAGLCSWVINIVRFHEVFCEVEVKRLCLSQANADLIEAAEKLEALRKKLTELDASLETLTSAVETATSEKLRCQEEVNRTNKTIELANRLVKGLESENVRWAHSVAQYHEQEATLCGDVLLTAAFISYAGSFSKKYRRELLDNLWMPFLRTQKVLIPMNPDLDPVSMLTDDATVAQWNNEGLPGDKMSTQNATILTNCERWPLLIDPQLQGIKWIKSRYGNSLKVVSLGQKGYVDVIEQAVVTGETVLIENLEETIDPVIDPLLGRHTIKKGSCIKVGDKECFFHPSFKLILHTKLANPHYKPEIQAQTTLINFTVTRDGLEDQLLAQVVNQERPDLEHLKSELTKQQNLFKIELKLLEDELLSRLSAAESNFLGDNVLVEKLETTKHTAAEIEMKVLEAKVNEVKINEAREHYRPVAVRASLLYFIMNDLNKINAMYQFSLKAYTVVFHKAVEMADHYEDVKSRVNTLIDCITYSTFNYISRGLFERDKLTFTAQLAFQLLLMSKEIDMRELDFLLRFNIDHSYPSPLEFLSSPAWSAIKTMSFTEEFRGLDRDIEGSPKRWKKVVESECPEKEKFPQEWKGKSSLQKLIMMRALRPDRMTYALRNFVEEKLGVKYTEGRKTEFAKSFRESAPASPVFFILSPGVDPLKDVEALGNLDTLLAPLQMYTAAGPPRTEAGPPIGGLGGLQPLDRDIACHLITYKLNLLYCTVLCCPSLLSSAVHLYCPLLFISTVLCCPSLLSSAVHLYCPLLFISTVLCCPSPLSSAVHLYCPLLLISTVLCCPSLLSSAVHLYCPLLFISTVLCCPSLLSSAVHLYCPLLSIPTVLCCPSPLSSAVHLYCPLLSIPTVLCCPSLLSSAVHLYCPLLFISTVLCCPSPLSSAVHLLCPLLFISTVLCCSSPLSSAVHLHCPLLSISTVLCCPSLLSSAVHLHCPLLFISFVLCCSSPLSSAVHLHCPLLFISIVLCRPSPLSSAVHLHCPLLSISTVLCCSSPLSSAVHLHCPLLSISTVLCCPSLLSSAVHLHCPLLFISFVLCCSSPLSSAVHLHCPLLFISIVLCCSSLLSSAVHLRCPLLFISTVLCCPSLLSSAVHLYCPLLSISTVLCCSSPLSSAVHLLCPLLSISTVLCCSSPLSSAVHLHCPLLFISTVLCCPSLLSSAVHLRCPLLFISTVLCCPSLLSSAVHLYCPLLSISTVLCCSSPLSSAVHLLCPLLSISTVLCCSSPLSSAVHLHCPLLSISTVLCCSSPLSSAVHLHCPLLFISTVLCCPSLLSSAVHLYCPLPSISTVLCCSSLLSSAVHLHCPLPSISTVLSHWSLGRKLGFTIDLGKLHNVSLGQGQEAVAEAAMESAAKEGHWIILQNIHLVYRWLGCLEKLLERCSERSHPDYRVFMSAEPTLTPQEHIIPQGILENAIKITNEPPTGMHANLHAALDNFDQDILDQCSREQEFKTILFSLCYFHACVAERRKFGPQGWNRKYPFNTGDLTISVNVLYNYLEANSQVPWEDLRYLFGEIMYGGHITDDWDRRLCRTYLEEYMQPNQFDRKLALAPGFVVPSNLDYQGYHGYVDEMLPHESPVHYGLHPNAEIEFLTVTSDGLFHTLLELQSPDAAAGEGASQSLEEKVKTVLDEVLERLPEEYNMSDISSKTAERSPYILVCFQECERMNALINEIRRSLKELDLGLRGELAISSEMEQLQSALFFENVPDTWTKLAYPSTYSLALWYNDVLLRCRELDSWTQDLSLPSVVWLSGLFNPQSFLTAVMQSLARKNEWPLDKMNLTVDVTKKFKEEFNQPAREGAYIYGLYMEGARWDTQAGVITEARLKELTPTMPVISVRAVPNDRQETRNTYECPLYKTKIRGPTYVWTFSLKTRERPAKWVLAGVALLLSV
ncbi:unnamed protein product [Boreogadus saida]